MCKAWIRVIFCSGPRQVINAITLYSVYKADLDPQATDIGSSFTGFFKNIEILAENNYDQAVVLSGMIFTLVIWVFAALSLLLAVFLYIFFLWHYIPNRDGGLSGYCERKINSRLTKIVSVKVNKAIEEEERKKRKAEQKAIKKGEKTNRLTATVPVLAYPEDDKLPEMPMLNRQDTMTTLPLYSSRPGTPSSGIPTMPDLELSSLDQKRPYAGRTVTQSSGMSTASYSSNAPLIGGASDMGYARAGSPAPSLPPLNTNNGYPGPQRTMTGNTNGSGWQQNGQQGLRMPNNGPRRFAQGPYTQSPVPFSDSPVQYGESQQRFNSPGPQQSMDNYGRNSPAPQQSMDNYGRPMPRQVADLQGGRSTPGSMLSRQATFPNMESGQPTVPNMDAGRQSPGFQGGRSSPAPSQNGRSSPAPSVLGIERPTPALRSPLHPDMRSGSAPIPNNNGYVAFNPAMRSASAAPNPTQQQYPGNNAPRPQYRNMTAPASQSQQQGSYFGAPRINNPQPGPPRVGTPTGQPPRVGTPNSMRNMSNDYRQPRLNDADSPQSYQSYQYPPDTGSSNNRPRPPPSDDRYQ